MSFHIICGHFVIICASIMNSLCVDLSWVINPGLFWSPYWYICQIINSVCEPFILCCHVQVFDQYTLQLKTGLLTGVWRSSKVTVWLLNLIKASMSSCQTVHMTVFLCSLVRGLEFLSGDLCRCVKIN